MIFVDTSIWYTLFVLHEPQHAVVKHWHDANVEPLITSDYTIDELLTLMSARKQRRYADFAGTQLLSQRFARLHMTGSADVEEAWRIYRSFGDKDWSFTDCVSYAQMQRLGIVRAASLDHHFRQFGFVEVVPAIP